MKVLNKTMANSEIYKNITDQIKSKKTIILTSTEQELRKFNIYSR
jgi:hypothetical protein